MLGLGVKGKSRNGIGTRERRQKQQRALVKKSAEGSEKLFRPHFHIDGGAIWKYLVIIILMKCLHRKLTRIITTLILTYDTTTIASLPILSCGVFVSLA